MKALVQKWLEPDDPSNALREWSISDLLHPEGSRQLRQVITDVLAQQVEQANAIPALPHINNRVWNSDKHGWGHTEWIYCGGDNRVFQIDINGPAVVRIETCNEPGHMEPQPLYAPQTSSFNVSTKETLLFVRFHIQKLPPRPPQSTWKRVTKTVRKQLPNGKTVLAKHTKMQEPDGLYTDRPDAPARVLIGVACR